MIFQEDSTIIVRFELSVHFWETTMSGIYNIDSKMEGTWQRFDNWVTSEFSCDSKSGVKPLPACVRCGHKLPTYHALRYFSYVRTYIPKNPMVGHILWPSTLSQMCWSFSHEHFEISKTQGIQQIMHISWIFSETEIMGVSAHDPWPNWRTKKASWLGMSHSWLRLCMNK